MKFINLKSYSPKSGTTSDCDIFIKASDIKMLLLFKTNYLFGDEDLLRCKKYNETNSLFIKEEDYLLLQKNKTDALKSALNTTGKIDSASGIQIAKTFFKSEEILSGEDKLGSMIEIANKFVVDLLNSSKDQRAKALVDLLKGLNNENDIFINHANQVAAISTMIALMIDEVSLDNILEINLVAVLHGMGLMLVSNQRNPYFDNYADITKFNESMTRTDQAAIQKVIMKHFDGHHRLTATDNVIFLQHFSLIEQNIDKIKIKNIKGQGILKTIADLKLTLATNESTKTVLNPYISSKILAIGDRLVSLMNFYKKNPSFIASSIREIENINNTDKPIFDKKIMTLVSQLA